MAIVSIATPKLRDDLVDPPSSEESLRRRVAHLIHERDRADARAEELDRIVSSIRAQHRYSLSIRCDGFPDLPCHSVVTVTTNAPPADGKLAHGVYRAAGALGWLVSSETVVALMALGSPWIEATGAHLDTCSDCRATARS